MVCFPFSKDEQLPEKNPKRNRQGLKGKENNKTTFCVFWLFSQIFELLKHPE